MIRRFTIGFGIGLLVFITINLLSAHLNSDWGLLAVFERDACADDIALGIISASILAWPIARKER